MLAMADSLTRQGINVKLVATIYMSDLGSKVKHEFQRITLKDFTHPLDINSLTFAVSEIAFMRLALTGIGRLIPGNLYDSLGLVTPILPELTEEFDLFIGNRVNNEQDAIDWINQAINKISKKKVRPHNATIENRKEL